VATYPHSDNISLVGLRWLSADECAPSTNASPASDDDTGTTPAKPQDPVQEAIDEIHRAMLEYADELNK
jgi:hypothetical protein